ncbi:MAG: polysaccharide lyase [Actinomycetia bacterium]|nr:polysaccharide lyase [Actinomycetes bacterium]MCH9801029.1 polysaccharide lyase [Actinomycetes bacterium]
MDVNPPGQDAPRGNRQVWIAAVAFLVAVLAGGMAAALALNGSPGASAPVEPTAESNDPILFAADFESGDLEALGDTPWNHRPTPPTIVTGDARQGRSSAEYYIPANGERSESAPPGLRFREGDVVVFSFATQLRNMSLDTEDWQVLVQWKDDGDSSPPVALVVENGRYEIGGGWGRSGTDPQSAVEYVDLGPATNYEWVDWVVRIQFASDPRQGSLDVWRDGVSVVTDWHPVTGTLYPGLESYLKFGYYRDAGIQTPSSVRHDDWVVWRQ